MKAFRAVPNSGCREAALASVRIVRDSEKSSARSRPIVDLIFKRRVGQPDVRASAAVLLTG
jgi:hypothetical protein